MRYVKLPKENLDTFVENLKTNGKVYGPVKTGEFHSFQEIKSSKDVSLDYTRTMIPPKKFFLKLKNTVFTFDEEKAEYKETLAQGKAVVLGVHACDIHALELLDKVYLDENPDKYYRTARRNTTIIGHSCHPDEYCFCQSLGTSYVTEGFDLFLHEIVDGYLVRIASERGQEIIAEIKHLTRDAEAEDIEEFKENERKRLTEFKSRLNVSGLQDMLELSHDSPVWEEYADKCFGCGTCNLVCPTCRCYDVVDYVNLDLKTGERIRKWDSCMLRRHALVAGGLNFRPTRVDRLRNRFNCKGSLSEGMLNCVGCGRCTVYCPADIQYIEVLQKVRGELA